MSHKRLALVITHTHWDREWYYSVEQYRSRLVRCLDLLLDIIAQDLPIKPDKGPAILLAEHRIACTGKRIHVQSSGQIEHFRLVKNYTYDPISRQYLLVGIVGKARVFGFHELPPLDLR